MKLTFLYLVVLLACACTNFQPDDNVPLNPMAASSLSLLARPSILDTIYVKDGWFGNYYSDYVDSFLTIDTTASCAWRGIYAAGACGSFYKWGVDIGSETTIIRTGAARRVMSFDTTYAFRRGFAIFDTRNSFAAESAKVRIHITKNAIQHHDTDSIWLVQFAPRDKDNCALSFSHLLDSCNFYRCGFYVFPISTTDNYCIPTDTGYWEIPLDKSLFKAGSYTSVGFVTRREPIRTPLEDNIFRTDDWDTGGQDICQLIYWHHLTPGPSQPPRNGRWGEKPWGEDVW